MKKFNSLALPVLLALGLSFTGCSSSKKGASRNKGLFSSFSNTLSVNGDSDSGKAGSLKTVSFGFNSSAISGETEDALNDNAKYLKANSSIEVQVEGHCDERGGVQYNLALGEKRAKAVRNYLASMGVPRRRITTISFGKEKPIAYGHEEGSWQQNRRANFVITAK